MRTGRVVSASLRSLRRFPLRSGFMMLGTLVGVAALTLVLSIGGAAERKVLTTVKQLFGESSVIVMARGGTFLGGPRGETARLTLDDIEAIARDVPEVETWDAQQALSLAAVKRGDASRKVLVMGRTERSERVWARGVSRGAYFDAAAVAGSARVALIGETVARALFGTEDPLGGEILVGPVPFQVIGVLERFGTDVHGMDRDDEVVVPLTTAMRRLLNVDTIAAAKLLVRRPEQVPAVAREVTRILRERHAVPQGRPSDFSLITAVEVRKMVGRLRQVLFVLLPLVAGVSLVAGGAVAAALMLASMSQRVAEIGLRRAVGARPEDIRLQFLLESALTTLAGGVVGLALGLAASRYLAGRAHLGNVLSWQAVAVGVVLSVATGLAAGLLPARRAARLEPAEALR